MGAGRRSSVDDQRHQLSRPRHCAVLADRLSPGDEFFDELNGHLADAGGDSDGYAWLALGQKRLGKVDPGSLSRLYTGDTGRDTCVVWVESETDGRALVGVVWTMLHAQMTGE